MKTHKILETSSFEESIDMVKEVSSIFVEDGLVALRGFKFSKEDQTILSAKIGDILNWDLNSQSSIKDSISNMYLGGHSDDPDRDSCGSDWYALDWHIEQVHLEDPIIAGSWNMFKFDAPKGSGSTHFVDGSDLYESFSDAERNLLKDSTYIWDKEDHEGGPYYTPAIGTNPYTGRTTLRVEAKYGCTISPKLHSVRGSEPTELQLKLSSEILQKMDNEFVKNTDLKYIHDWKENDLVFVDLYRMYHGVTGGYKYNNRKFNGIFMRQGRNSLGD